ncbi:hypothetical protein [Arthrobacter rhizosphaerae]|uniref:hypothetical protein n=1 Tax=Arthrobacter rhizosphaerae TaxID=2855490 RepID=UPI001FF3742F|nr:hypothetical protein [Arthrobacter rhizosphaerae]
MSYTPVSGSERIIDQVLAEAGLEDADDLRPVLLELRSLGAEQPGPSAQILALMEGTTGAGSGLNAGTPDAGTSDPEIADTGTAVVVDLAARRRNKRRLPLTVFGVAAALAVGGGAAAAADQGVRDTLHSAFTSIAATFGSESHKPEPKNQTVPGPAETSGGLQGTLPTPTGAAPTTPGADGSPANGNHAGQDVRSPGSADSGEGSGKSFGSPWLKGTPPAIQDVPGAAGVPTPGLTPPDLRLPSLPAVPTPERTDGSTPQP